MSGKSWNSMPIFGHVKATADLARGEVNKGAKALYEANKTTIEVGETLVDKIPEDKIANPLKNVLDVAKQGNEIIGKVSEKGINAIPVVGHVQAAAHLARGEVDESVEAVYVANKATLEVADNLVDRIPEDAVAAPAKNIVEGFNQLNELIKK